jgi:hypothetical protein
MKLETELKSIEIIHEVLTGKDDEKVCQQFMKNFGSEIAQFEKVMANVYEHWTNFDAKFSKTEDSALVTALLLKVVNGHIMSFRLLITGYWVAAGNTQRQVFEGCAMTIIASKYEWPYLKRYMENRFSINKAIDVLKRRWEELNIRKEAVMKLENGIIFYDGLSHPTLLTLTEMLAIDGSHNVYIGTCFDSLKIEGYKKEIEGRIRFAKILNNMISGVQKNMRSWNL